MSEIDCAFPGDAEHDHEMCVDAVRERAACGMARNIGRDHGRCAASWFFDGNTDRATYELIRHGLEDGDPLVLDQLPAADLSGQWADGYTVADLMKDVDGDESDQDQIVEAYEEGHMDGVRYEIEQAIARQLD